MAGNFFHTAHPHRLTDMRLTLLIQTDIFWEKIEASAVDVLLLSCGRRKRAACSTDAKLITFVRSSYRKAYHTLFHQQRRVTATQWQPEVSIHGDRLNDFSQD